MDPNLEKIRDHHLKSIKAGETRQPISEARDYLRVILGAQYAVNAQIELNDFIQNVEEMKDGKEQEQ